MKSARMLAARGTGLSSSTQVSTLAAPRAASRSLAKASVRPDSRMSSTSRTITREGKKIDLRRQSRAVQRAQQIRSEHEAALEDRHDEQILERGGGDVAGDGGDAGRDGLGREDHLDGLARGLRIGHAPTFLPGAWSLGLELVISAGRTGRGALPPHQTATIVDD